MVTVLPTGAVPAKVGVPLVVLPAAGLVSTGAAVAGKGAVVKVTALP